MPKSRTSYVPTEAKRFDAAIKVSLHKDEFDRITKLARESSQQTASEWVREAVRMRLKAAPLSDT